MNGDPVVFLVRHGRTRSGVTSIWTPTMSARSRRTRWPTRSRGYAISIVFTSSLARAVQTPSPTAAATSARIEVDQALIGRDCGPWAGRPAANVVARFGSRDAAPDVEPATHRRRLAVEAAERAADLAAEGPVAIVAHDAVNRAVLAALVPALGTIDERTRCWNRLERTPSGWPAPIADAPGEGRPVTNARARFATDA